MTDSHVDRKVLSDLQDIMEDDYITLLETFLKDSEKRLEDLGRARTAEQVAQAAHSFKGRASNMGAHGLAQLCQQLEADVRTQPSLGIEHLIMQICREYSEVRRVFRDECQRVKVS